MRNDHSALFSPFDFGPFAVKNRVVRSATNDYGCEKDGSISPFQIGICRELAENEVGLIFTGNFSVSSDGDNGSAVNRIYGPVDLTRLSELTGEVHARGCRIVAQLNHSGGRTKSEFIGGARPMAPSSVEYFSGVEKPREMTEADIGRVVGDFAEAAAIAKEAGFDGVQIHCAHGYLLSQFLNPGENLRNDGYGGAAEKRFRIVEEIIEAAKRRCGGDYPLFIKFNSNAAADASAYLEDVRYFLVRCQALGLRGAELSGFDFMGFGKDAGPYYTGAVASLRRGLKLPLILVGGIRDFAGMEAALDSGADLVSLSRPFICESDLITRLMAGQEKSKCVSCNKCFTLYKKEKRRCVFHRD